MMMNPVGQGRLMPFPVRPLAGCAGECGGYLRLVSYAVSRRLKEIANPERYAK